MDGELYFKAAVALTDRHPGTQFREMLGHDLLASQMERLYFQDEWRGLELYGWNSFCLKMEEEGQGKWLAKIKELDSEVMLGHLETQLMQASRDGKAPNRALLEATVKALQGVSALARVNGEGAGGNGASTIDVRFIPSLAEPCEPESLERFFARLEEESKGKALDLPSPAEGGKEGDE